MPEVKAEVDITISKAPNLLKDIHNPFLVLEKENAIVTRLDIIVKTVNCSNNE